MGASKSLEVLDGSFEDGKYYDEANKLVRNANGRFRGQHGYIYEGQIVSGKKSGFGREILPEIGVYEGTWQNDMKHG